MQLAQLIQGRGLHDSQVTFRDLSHDRRAQRQAVAWAVADYAQWHKPDDVGNQSACVQWAETAAQKRSFVVLLPSAIAKPLKSRACRSGVFWSAGSVHLSHLNSLRL